MKVFAIAVVVVIALAGASAADDPYTGTWTLNLAKSGGNERTQVLTIKVLGDEETYQSDMMSKEGRRQVTNYTAKYDGKEYPSVTVVTENGKSTRTEGTIMLKKIDLLARERRSKQPNGNVNILRRTVSADGKVLTSQSYTLEPNGKETKGTTALVFDRK
jgi:hypothetical protein